MMLCWLTPIAQRGQHKIIMIRAVVALSLRHHIRSARRLSDTVQYNRYLSSISSSTATKRNSDNNNPVVIVGGGPTGLLLSTLLSTYNIPSTLLEARRAEAISGPNGHPQAHYINLRTMEILRHNLPDLYDKVVNAMPPVKEWEGFGFGHSVLGRSIGRVVHPVTGLCVGMEGNGLLVKEYGEDNDGVADPFTRRKHSATNQRVSPCDPGHLAQNKFAALLLQAAENAAQSVPGTEILHGVSVQNVLDHGPADINDASPLEVQTKCGRTFDPKLVVAADGASSPVRQAHSVQMLGRPALQHLISVHFRTSPPLSAKLAADSNKSNMLQFIFNERLVGCFVCHDLQQGEWVLQVPYFEPFQTANGYTPDRVKELVRAGLGLVHHDDGAMNDDIDILSIRPWTMSSTVAETYVAGPSERIVLAGDAAHAFPPAGGFGMNTGLQDAHNLAWRLALNLRSSGDDDDDGKNLTKSLHQYESDRRPIASQNAALSVRNYNRTLEVAKACYLNADHPALLVKAMSVPPLSFVPLGVRKNMFDAAVKAATLPLSGLSTVGNPYGERIKRNVRNKLGKGEGLPLLFPRYEVGFGYGQGCTLGEGDDTAGYHPTVEAGRRLPHINLDVVALRPEDFGDENIPTALSLTDVGSQIRSLHKDLQSSAPRFTAIFSGSLTSRNEQVNVLLQATASAANESGISIDVVIILPERVAAADVLEKSVPEGIIPALVLADTKAELSSKLGFEGVIFVRPDGHIAILLPFDNNVHEGIDKERILSGINEIL